VTLQRIPTSELRIGMYFERADGTWLDHSLWRTKFLIADQPQLDTVLGCGAKVCWIDPDKGATEVPPAARSATPAAAPVSCGAARPAAQQARKPASLEAESVRAARVCNAARAAVVSVFDDIRLGKSPNVEATRPIVEQIVESIFSRPGALLGLAHLKQKDEYTFMHSVSVCALAATLGRELGFDEQRCRAVALGGLLHDVGKALIPLEILNKPGKLSPAEFAQVQRHTTLGHQLLLDNQFTDPDALDVCLHHHEKLDGTGYPEGLASDGVSQMARIGAVCDVFDAVTSSRPYKEAWDPAIALKQMASWTGHFDRRVLAAFIKAVGVYPVGTLVRLASGRLAVVVEDQPGHPRAPLVRVFFSTKSNEPLPTQLVDLAAASVGDRIVDAEPREKWNFPHLDELCRVTS
jgi:HD-GYP domain-containing protein (c-di-GMP phosphodiesterase class II)